MSEESILARYESNLSLVSKRIHPADDMFAKSPKGWDDYDVVGRSAIKLISDVVGRHNLNISRILDFGCGHGRVARHLRVAFPAADLSFSDIDESGWRFCAEEFDGTGFPSTSDFSQLDIPGKYDLIWLGSVFTHLDWDRSVSLLKALGSSLGEGGVVIATVRGRTCYNVMIGNPERHNIAGYYDRLLRDFESKGFGYMDYKGFDGWGQHLIDKLHLDKLGISAGLVTIDWLEAGWANIHDVAVWQS